MNLICSKLNVFTGSAGVLFGHPLDTVKCQLQVQRAENKYRGLWDCCVTIHKQGMVYIMFFIISFFINFAKEGFKPWLFFT